MSEASEWLEYSTPPEVRNLETDPDAEMLTRQAKGVWRAGLPGTVLMWAASVGCIGFLINELSFWSRTGFSLGVIVGSCLAAIVLAATVFVTVVTLDDARRVHTLRVSPRGLQVASTGVLGLRNRVWMREEIDHLRIFQQVHHTQPLLLLIESTGRNVVLVSGMPREQLIPLEEHLRTILNLPPSEKR